MSFNSTFLSRSLQNHIIPAYEILKGFLQSHEQTITRVICYSYRVASNVKLLLHNEVSHSNIARLFCIWPRVYSSSNLLKTVHELKELGFDSSTSYFGIALLAKRSVTQTMWAEKLKPLRMELG